MWPDGQLLQSGKYKILKHIGGGGFGLTYLAEDQALRRQVVIKAPNQLYRADQDYEKFIRRFQREGQALAKIDHPNIVQVIELCQEAGMPCLVMTYVEGETLNERIRNRGRLLEAEAVRAFRKLAKALERFHQAGFVHCDIHPGNIILKPNGEPVLIDFGSAKLLQPGTLTVTTTFNQSFAPYEQGNQDGTPQVTLDIYGLSATLYFAVTGEKPQAAINRKLYDTQFQSPKTVCDRLSDWLNQAITTGMALEAKDRPVSMQAWMGLVSPPEPPRPRTKTQANTSHVQPQPSKSTPPHSDLHQSKFTVPWLGLCTLFIGYLPIGVILGLTVFDAGTRVLAWAWALAWLAGGFSVSDFDLAGVLAGDLALAMSWVLTVVGSIAVALIGALVGARSGMWAGALAGALLSGGGLGYFTSISIWGGLGIGLIVFVQFFCIVFGFGRVHKLMGRSYQNFTILIVLGSVPMLSLGLGGVFGWCLKFSGVSLPS